MKDRKILCVDDEEDILTLVSSTLEKDGYTVLKTESGSEALKYAETFQPDLILLDIMMPEPDGIDVCRSIRMKQLDKQPYIYFLTAKTDEFDEILGLEIGADDYIVKPFSPRKISSKVKALFRRIEDKENVVDKVLKVGNIVLNPQSHTVTINNEERKFLRKEFDLLQFLMKRQGHVFSRSDLLNYVWGEDVYFVERTVDVHITKIRKKIDPYSHFIQTVQGVGYKLIARQ